MSDTVHLGKYHYSRSAVIGKGAMASVYLGTLTGTTCPVAIKVVNMKEIDRNEVTRYLLQNEKKALQILNHPNISKVLDIIQDSQHCHIVMEYCSNGNLADYVKKHYSGPNPTGLSQGQILKIFRQIVEAFSFIQSHHVLHRDIKPSNILLTQNLCPKISDFGFCEVQSFLAKPQVYYNVGSPSYMAPEVYTKNQYSHKGDVWSLGALLYQLASGNTYDDGMQILQAYKSYRKNGHKFLRNVSKKIRKIINACMNFDISQRPEPQHIIHLIDSSDNNIINQSPHLQSFSVEKRISEANVFTRPAVKTIIQGIISQGSLPMTQKLIAQGPIRTTPSIPGPRQTPRQHRLDFRTSLSNSNNPANRTRHMSIEGGRTSIPLVNAGFPGKTDVQPKVSFQYEQRKNIIQDSIIKNENKRFLAWSRNIPDKNQLRFTYHNQVVRVFGKHQPVAAVPAIK